MSHSHCHSHSHSASSSRIGWAFFLNLIFTIIEFIGGILTNSAAIMADAVHDLGDCLSIGLAWILNTVSHKKADSDFSYGYRRFSLLGAVINGAVLIAGSVWVMSIALPRLSDPIMPHIQGMIGLAILGIAVNGFAALRLSAGKTLNEKVLNWHLLEDVLGWVAVLIVAIILLFVEWPVLDPVLSIAFTVFILFGVGKNFIRAAKLFLQGTPDKQLSAEIVSRLESISGIDDVHHLHFWSLDGERHVLTAHVIPSDSIPPDNYPSLKADISKVLKDYPLDHTTIELEYPAEQCRDSG